MGGTESKSLVNFDEKNALYEEPMLAHTCRGDNIKYLSWKSTPEEIKKKMREHVRGWIRSSKAWSICELYIPGYMLYVRKGMATIAILYSYAILDEIDLIRETDPRPFTLSSDGRGWSVHFIFSIYTAKKEEAPKEEEPKENTEQAQNS
jgi:hypothetical protein